MTFYIGQQHPITLYRTVFGVCFVLVSSVIRCSGYYFFDRILFHHDFYRDNCDYHWDSLGSANAQLPGCFRPWTFSLNIGLDMLPSDSFMSCLHSLLGYSTGEFQACPDCPCGV